MRRFVLTGTILIGITACAPAQVEGDSDGGLPAADAGHADAEGADGGGGADRGGADSRQPDGAVPDSTTRDNWAADSFSPDRLGHDGQRADTGVDAAILADAGECVDPAPTADRPVAIACSPCRPFGYEPGGEGDCALHADCTDGVNGRCLLGMIGAYCSYDTCFDDDDCASDQLCSCDGATYAGANTCVPANCRVNADCASDRCSPSYGCLLGGSPNGWYCRTTADECVSDDDCTEYLDGRCAFSASAEHWLCQYGVCIP